MGDTPMGDPGGAPMMVKTEIELTNDSSTGVGEPPVVAGGLSAYGLTVGQAVQARFGTTPNFADAVVAAINNDGSVEVNWNSGAIFHRTVHHTDVRAKPTELAAKTEATDGVDSRTGAPVVTKTEGGSSSSSSSSDDEGEVMGQKFMQNQMQGIMPPGMVMPSGMRPPDMAPPPGGPPGACMELAIPGGNVAATQPMFDTPAAPPKRRPLKGIDEAQLAKLLSGLHSCLKRLVLSFKTDAATPEIPVGALEEEFERFWRVQFDARSMGEPNTVSFLRRFPDVFRVRSNGVQLLVGPVESPNFEAAVEASMEQPENPADSQAATCDFAVSSGEQVLALIGNLIAEDRKALGAPLGFQFANFELAQELLGKLREPGTASEEADLFDLILDPQPPLAKGAAPHGGKGEGDRDNFRDPPRSFQPQPFADSGFGGSFDEPPPWARPNGGRRGGPPIGGPGLGSGNMGGGFGGGYGPAGRGDPNEGFRPDRRGSDGRSLCRQFQNGRCTYGDTCKFMHERPGGGPY